MLYTCFLSFPDHTNIQAEYSSAGKMYQALLNIYAENSETDIVIRQKTDKGDEFVEFDGPLKEFLTR